MAKTIFITGGARSGKSRLAEQIALEHGAPLCYIATAQALDGEMDQRIIKHQQRRGEAWQTIEEPLSLAQALKNCDNSCKAILVDCITLWLTNLIFKYENQGDEMEELVMKDVHHLAATLGSMTTPVILVSNEVGLGIVPEHKLGRIFRDIAGQANQILAAAAADVYTVISGIPLKLK
jgi:adenosylcobinamide kinase / adenosylcobinamide-phosphate guanylyltransferase